MVRLDHDDWARARLRQQRINRLEDLPVHELELVAVAVPVFPELLLELELVRDQGVAEYPAVLVEEIGMMWQHEMRKNELGFAT